MSLVELLVGMTLSSLVLGMLAANFSLSVRTRGNMELQLEVDQGVRATLSTLSQELRQAGACLPTTGHFLALDAQNHGKEDTLTVRSGRVNPKTMSCVRTVLQQEAPRGTAAVRVADTSGFANGDWIYMTRNGGAGNTFRVAGVSGKKLLVNPGLDARYPAGGGVFAIEERVYAIAEEDNGNKMLTVAVDGEDAQPLVDGVDRFNVRYHLAPCPPCTAVDEPGNDTRWRQVRKVSFEVRVSSARSDRSGKTVRRKGRGTARPRNFL